MLPGRETTNRTNVHRRAERGRTAIGTIAAAVFLPGAIALAILSAPEPVLAKKGGGGKEGGLIFSYSVAMNGDLSIDGGFGEDCTIHVEPPLDWGKSFETGIRVVRPRPRICISHAFLQSGNVTLDGLFCVDGVIPCAQGSPNWGVLTIDVGQSGPFVSYSVGETDAESAKIRRYTLQTIDPVILIDAEATWPAGTGDQLDPSTYTVTIPVGTRWSLVEKKPGKVDAVLTSQVATSIFLTEVDQ